MGASDSRYGSRVPKRTKSSSAQGVNINPGPFEAVIKNVIDTTRAGRLQVWIPELGAGDQEDPNNWYTVSYASPFAGMTDLPDTYKNATSNTFELVQHTYGFWAIPPDTGNIVLVIFINGDPDRGYWFACTINKLGHQMTPGIPGGTVDQMETGTIIDSALKKALTPDSVWPLAELQENLGQNVNADFMTTKRPAHEWQAKRYIQQGLDRDPVRGANSSSGQRNMPSAVFGMSSPGRKLKNDPADNPDIAAKVESGDITDKDLFSIGRKGGHSFVMDDGDFYGKNQVMRLRTSYGHEILMDDTNKMTYIINSEGSCWIELAGSGQMHIFTSGGFNVRSQGDINMHSDTNINMHAEDKIQMFAGNQIDINTKTFNQLSTNLTKIYAATVQVGASGPVNLSAGGGGSFKAGGLLALQGAPIHLNTSSPVTVQKPEPIPKLLHDDTALNSSTGLWEIQTAKLTSIVSIVPAHEPWTRENGTSQSSAVSGG